MSQATGKPDDTYGALPFRWEKQGLIFPISDYGREPWMQEFAQAPSALVYEDFVRVYFSCRGHRDENGQYASYSTYVDLDRNDLTRVINVAQKPILDLGSVGAFDEFGIYPVSVIRDEGRIVAYYGGWTRCRSTPYNVAIGMAVSCDGGVSFSRIGSGPVLSYSLDEPTTVSGPKVRHFDGLWYLWYVAGTGWLPTEHGYESIFKIRMATSVDGLNWEIQNRQLIEDVLDENECQASPDVLYLNGRYHMFFSYKFGSNFRGTNRGYRIGYAWSTDLLNWKREDSKAGISVSQNPSDWDGVSIAYPHVFQLDGELKMLYLGNDVGRLGFGLATAVID